MFINHMNGYDLEFSSHAHHELNKLEDNTHDRIMHKLDLLVNGSPDVDYKKLAGQEDLHRLRVGHYRVVLTVDDDSHSVQVLEIGERAHVYDHIH